ncbi:MAG: hypothetical protein E7555_09960 [Ruminococcaceae bacterium]|nr:hypothetical protein [Oscillospiraceae bacterium]
MKKKILSIISTCLVLAVLLSTFAGMSVNAAVELSKPEIVGIRAENGVVFLEWYDYNEEFSGFYVYRSESGKAGTWKRIATVNEMCYEDASALPNKTYYYTVKTILKEGKKVIASGSCAKEMVKTTLDRPVFSLAGNSGMGVLLKWDAIKGAAGVIIYKSTTGKAGSWSKLKTIKSGKAGSYTDNKVEIGKTYYYCIKYWKTVDGKDYYSQSSKAYKLVIKDVAVPENFEVRATSEGMLISYSKVLATKGYAIFKSTSGKAGTWKKIAMTKSNNTLSYLDKEVVYGIDYYYCVKSYKNLNGKNIYSDKSENYCETCKKGTLTISPSVSEVVFSELLEKQNVQIYVDGAPKYDVLKAKVDDPTVVAIKWGQWKGDIVDIELTRIGAGDTTLTLYYDNYPDSTVTIEIRADKLDLDDDYNTAKQYMEEAYKLFSEVLTILSETQKDGITDAEKLELAAKAKDKIGEAVVLLEKANVLAQKYADIDGADAELTANLLKVANIIKDFANTDALSGPMVSMVMGYLNQILKSAGIK